MCGYLRCHIPNRNLREFMELLGLPDLFPEEGGEELVHYYPAFGKNPNRTVNAMYRNLSNPYWKAAIRHNRAIIVATGLGESKMIEGRTHQYLMTSRTPILMGAVYRQFPGALYSCAVITRPSHPRFDKYHDKAMPLFLPYNSRFLEMWLSDEREDHPAIASLLDQPKLYPTLEVQEVKTFGKGQPIGRSAVLEADDVDSGEI